ncbi:ribonuclease H [Trifolium pratense]|uniref:Ribonuclease H n=1 Tax=Trifolium pratense TaxID=57577 RepID=A0A2K3MMQ7_TRIPR|nr:ribonuclease H [Trifolium pratense]
MTDICHLAKNNRSPQCKVVINDVLIHILYAIWIAINKVRFKNEKPCWRSLVSWIFANITMAGNFTSKLSFSALRDFITLMRFNVTVHSPKPTTLKEVIWQPPLSNWVKCNTDGTSTNSSPAYGGLFRNSDADFLYGFAENTSIAYAFVAELCGAMNAIQIVASKNWKNLWLKTDSTLVVLALKSAFRVPWALRNSWHNCLLLTHSMNFIVSHIFREENFCADGLANVCILLDGLTFWNELPLVIKNYFDANRLGKPFFRVVYS